ncbi:MAG: patatin-like protein [Pseudomonadota bacterium]
MKDQELRLALVCYGGISLAVYMHGITKEIWHLARASRAFHDGDSTAGGSFGIYRTLLQEIETAADIRLRILPDIIAGASAGGINGIFLGQAIATGQSLDPLTDLWLERADIDALLSPAAAPVSRFSKLWALPLAWMAAGRDRQLDEGLASSEGGEVRTKLSRFIRSRWFEPPFGGPEFTGILLDAFEAMAKAPRGPRLLPPDQPLDLFVTVTDFRGHPERLQLNSPPEVVETEHRLVIPFSDRGIAGDSLAALPELAFAARATSSFPGAFPPFTVGELDGVLAQREQRWPGRNAFLNAVLPRQAAAGGAEGAVLIDGSVLANAPFRPAIDALRERPARHQIDRRFVYVDPSPGMKLKLGGGGKDGVPGFFQTILGALSELPRKQPIRDNLDTLTERSERIERMRAIIANIRPEVEQQVESLFGLTLFLDRPTPRRLLNWRRRAQVAAARQAGYGHAAYGHLKIAGVIALVTELLYHIGGQPGPQRWAKIREALTDTLAVRGVDVPGGAFAGGADPETIAFLRWHDLGFRIRRLRLLARRLSELEADNPAGTDLEPVRHAIYDSLGAYLSAKMTEPYADLRQQVRAIHDNAGPVLDALAKAMDLTGLDAQTDAALAHALAGLTKEQRRPLLLAYLGFPFFDVATLPLLQGEGLDEFDPIKVDRISPDDATAIRAGGAEATLKGIQFNSFGAFFSRAWRENDYLWGRLHGAERLIDIVLSALPAGVRLRPGHAAALRRAVFLAILAEEEPRLTAIPALFGQLRREIG